VRPGLQLQVMSTETPPPIERTIATGSALLDIGEVADILKVEVRHVRRLVFERRIPYVKWGHLIRFDLAEINAWIDEARVPALPDPVTRRTAPGRASPPLRVASSE
jgi:excisionase family DNA binding protein